jgi:hypothetical protein
MKLDRLQIHPVDAEWMDITASQGVPVDELDPEFEGAWVWRTKSSSWIPSRPLNVRIAGMVASPTPTVPISSDSIRVTDTPACSIMRASAAAHIQPEVPPPAMTIFLMGPEREDVKCMLLI